MGAGEPQTPERRGVGARLVANQQFWCEALLLRSLDQPERGSPTGLRKRQHVFRFCRNCHLPTENMEKDLDAAGVVEMI
jgi:hypothetical protein